MPISTMHAHRGLNSRTEQYTHLPGRGRLEGLGRHDVRPAGERRTGPNLVYPVTGSTGMAEVVRTYIELEIMTDLAPTERSRWSSSPTNSISRRPWRRCGSIDVDLKTAVGSLRLTKASVTGYALERMSIRSRSSWRVTVSTRCRSPRAAREDGRAEGSRANRRAQAQGRARQGAADDPRRKRREKSRNRVLIELERQRRVADDRAVAERVLGAKLP